MRFSIGQGDLLPELEIMKSYMGKGQVMPILASFYIETGENQVILRATDLEQSIVTVAPAEIHEEGAAVVEGKKFIEYIKSLSGQLEISLDHNGLTTRSGRASLRAQIFDVADYPSKPDFNFEAHGIEFEAGLLYAMLNRVAVSMSKDVHKYALCGALLESAGGLVRAVATNGHHMALTEKELDAGKEFSEIIPAVFVRSMLKTLKGVDRGDQITIGIAEERRLFLKIGERVISSKVIDGQFPGYLKAIPFDLKMMTFDRQPLASLVKRQMLASTQRSRLCTVLVEEKRVLFKTKSKEDTREAVDHLPFEWSHQTEAFGVNIEYLSKALGAFTGEHVEFHFGGMKPIKLVDPEPPYELRHLMVIMPMRTEDKDKETQLRAVVEQ